MQLRQAWVVSLLIGACVDRGSDELPNPEATTGSPGTTGDEPGSSDESTSDESTSAESSSGEAALCSDGVVDDTEACDDGNTEPGDGCEPDCTHTPGTLLWARTYDGAASGTNTAVAVATDRHGDIFVGGALRTGSTVASQQAWLTKLNGDGSQVWSTTYEENGEHDEVGEILVHDDGSLLVSGWFNWPGSGIPIVHWAWLDADGTLQRYYWDDEFPDNGWDSPLAPTDDGGTYVFRNWGTNDITPYAHVERWSAERDELWRYDFENVDSARMRVEQLVTSGDGVLAIGYVGDYQPGEPWTAYGVVQALSSDAQPRWRYELEDPQYMETEFRSGGATADGGAVLLRWSASAPDRSDEVWSLVWLDSAGQQAGEHALPTGSDGAVDVRGMAVAADDAIVLTGTRGSEDARDAWVLALHPDGTPRWSDTFDLEFGADVGNAVTVDPAGDVIAVGQHGADGGQAWVRKYAG